MFTLISNHVEQGLDRLVTQYQTAENLQMLLTAFIDQVQIIEDVLSDMNIFRYLDQAFGVQLDNIGQIVGLPRPPGASDDTYRMLLKGQIKINISDGQPEQIIQLYQILTNSTFVLLFEGFNCSIIVEGDFQIADQATADNLITLLEQATAAGVRVDGLVSFDTSMAFAYDGNLPGVGYDDGSQTVGGKYPFYWTFIGGGFAYDGTDTSGLGYGSTDDPLAGGAYLT